MRCSSYMYGWCTMGYNLRIIMARNAPPANTKHTGKYVLGFVVQTCKCAPNRPQPRTHAVSWRYRNMATETCCDTGCSVNAIDNSHFYVEVHQTTLQLLSNDKLSPKHESHMIHDIRIRTSGHVLLLSIPEESLHFTVRAL